MLIYYISYEVFYINDKRHAKLGRFSPNLRMMPICYINKIEFMNII